MSQEDDEFIPYLVLIRFDKGEDLRDRIEESLPLLRDTLAELGRVEPVMSSYDGSAVAYLLAATSHTQPRQILSQLEAPRSRRPSPLKTHDKALVVTLDVGVASRLERVADWLGEYGLLA